MNIYLKNEIDFEKNGLGFLTDCISANVTEILNGDMYLQIEYKIDGNLNEYLNEENIIKCNVGNNNYQLFRIKKVEKDLKKINIYAQHIFYDLLTNFILDTYPKDLNCNAMGNWILSKTNYSNNFNFYSDITGTKSARYVRKNPVEIILGNENNSIVNLFDGELERDNFTIKMLAHRGNDYGTKVEIGKNIKSIKTSVNITSTYTRILPVGFDGLMLPEMYVDSPLINNYVTPRIVKIDFSEIAYDETGEIEDAYTNIEDAYTALRNAVNKMFEDGLDKPLINIKVDWLELSKTKEYEQYKSLETLHLADIVTVNILGFDYKTKIIKTIYNVLTDSIDKFEVGTLNSSIVNSVIANSNKVEKINVTSILESAKTNATGLITTAMGGYIYKTQSELFIMDTDNPNTAQKVWRWNINGLGYSSTGINGPYGLAMTMDGQIVADFITTGKLNTNVIEGYNDLIIEVDGKVDNSDFTKANIILKINDDTSQAKINAGIINLSASDVLNILAGNTINLTSKNIAINSTNFNVDKNGNLTANNANITGGKINISSEKGVAVITLTDVLTNTRRTEVSSGGLKITNINGELNLDYDSTPYLTMKYGDKSSSFGYNKLRIENVECDNLKVGRFETSAMQTGICTLNSSGDTTVYFKKAFNDVPKVVLTPYTIANGVISAKISEITTTYFKANIGGTNFGNNNFCYIAVYEDNDDF